MGHGYRSIKLNEHRRMEKKPEEQMRAASRPGFEESSSSQLHYNEWMEAQDLLKKRLITEDDFTWKIPANRIAGSSSTSLTTTADVERGEDEESLKYVGGVDISFSKKDSSIACGTLVVLDLKTLQVVYEDFSLVTLQVPYVAGFLAFREAPILLELLDGVKDKAAAFYPQLLMVDGNGVLHPRGFGLACHVGVLANLPTIGIGKNLHHVDGLTQSKVRHYLESSDKWSEDFIDLMGSSGCIWGVAMRSAPNSSKPIFISIGHRVSLDTAIAIVKMTCKFRVPEPIRQADIRSREYIRKFQLGMQDHGVDDPKRKPLKGC